MKHICVYGSSSWDLDKKYIEPVEHLGQRMAQRGFGLVFGGGAQGLMGAVARGMKKEDGVILGVAPEFFDTDGVLYKECTDFIYPANMRERKEIMEEASDAFIVTPGGVGTWEEFFEVFTLKQLQQINKPIVIFNIDHYYDLLLDFIEKGIEGTFIKEACKKLYYVSDDVEDILDYIENYNEKPIVVKAMRTVITEDN